MAAKRRKKVGDYTEYNTVKIIRGGANYFAQIEAIAASATYSLHLQTYIFDEDETGTRVAEVLISAAQRGVYVYVLLDGYASQGLSKTFIKRLISAGIHFRYFEPMMRSKNYYFGRRMHHKLIVADARVCMVGGLNISNRYNDMPTATAWLDWALMVEGEAAAGIDKICVRMWDRAVFKKKCNATNNPATAHQHHKCLVRIHRNDWVYKQTQITASYYEMLTSAKSHVTIMTSYFWPPQNLLKKMEAAVRRGVEVRIILTSNADVPLAKYAEKYLYRRLLRNKIEIYEYNKNVLHGKIAVQDRKWVTVGSYNVNNISAFASIELNLDVLDNHVAAELNDAVQQIIDNDCTLVTKDNFAASNNVVKKLFYYLSYFTIHTLFFLFTFYFSQHTRKN